ncbi:MAG: bacterial Ig-like domain-containing protein [Clostridia bacterium]|nr:bacterial Ig-like domain-containing protein [Clostridia bacterium]
MSIAISGEYKTEYEIGEEFDPTGIVVTATLSDETTKDVSAEVIFTGFDSTEAGEKTLTATYGTGNSAVSTTFVITVNSTVLSVISIKISGGYKTEYEIGEELDITGLVVTAYMSDGTTKDVTSDVVITGFDSSEAGNITLVVTYRTGDSTVSTTFSVTVNHDGLQVDLSQFSFQLNQYRGLTVTPSAVQLENTTYYLEVPAWAVNQFNTVFTISAPSEFSTDYSVVYTSYTNNNIHFPSEGTIKRAVNGTVEVTDYFVISEDLEYSNFTFKFENSQRDYTLILVPYNDLNSLKVYKSLSDVGTANELPVSIIGANSYSVSALQNSTIYLQIKGGIINANLTDSEINVDGAKKEDSYLFSYDVGTAGEYELTVHITNTAYVMEERQYRIIVYSVETDHTPIISNYGGNIQRTVYYEQGETGTLFLETENTDENTVFTWFNNKGEVIQENSSTLFFDTSVPQIFTVWCVVTNEVNNVSYSARSAMISIGIRPISDIAVPIFVKQPVSAEYTVGSMAEPLEAEISVPGGGYLYDYQWFENNADSSEGGTPVSDIIRTAYGKVTYTPETNREGSFWYYCEVVAIFSLNNEEQFFSNPAVTSPAQIKFTKAKLSFDGDGTAQNPYLIKTYADLIELRDSVAEGNSFSGVYFQLANNIPLESDWIPIGITVDGTNDVAKTGNLRAFSGIFDGNGKTITIAHGGLPLFNYVNGATIQNLNIYGTQINGYGLINEMHGYGLSGTSVTISGVRILSGTKILKSGLFGGEIDGNINGFAGVSAGYEAHITDCTIESGVTIGYDGSQSYIGSFVGRLQGTIENCVSFATVNGTNYVGGIIGTRDNALGKCTVIGCEFNGTVTASGDNAGGIVGGGYSNSTAPNGVKVTVQNCLCGEDAVVTGKNNVGGILGGDVYVACAWNSYSFIGNQFTGTVSGNSNVGGIIGFYDSLNVNDNIAGNYYKKDCGASEGIGKVAYVDTNCITHETASGAVYFNTEVSTGGCPDVAGCHWQVGLQRSDDPLGTDKEKLTTCNQSAEVVPVSLTISGTPKKQEYTVGDVFNPVQDLDGITLTVAYSDGSKKVVSLSEVTVGNLDTSTAGTDKKVTITYGSVSAFITLTVKPKAAHASVTISVLGHYLHDSDTDGQYHGLANGGLSTWAGAKAYEAETTETVWDVLQRAFAANGITPIYTYSSTYGSIYISGLRYNGLTLEEFSNGKNSGWLYTINGVEANVGVSLQYVKDGDVIVFFYTDDYTQESGSQQYNDDDTKAAKAVEKLIDAIGTPVTLDSEAKIEAARKAYDTLNFKQKSLVSNYATLIAAEEALKKLKEEEDQKAVDAVIARIDQINMQMPVTIQAARDAYDRLTDAQKARVTNYAKLVEAERKLEEDKATAADKAAAAVVIGLISKINNPVSMADEAAIKEAREAYNQLTELQKRFVSNYNQLTDAERQLANLKATEEDKKAAAEVAALIDAIGSPVTREDEEAIKEARFAYDALTDVQKALVTNADKLTNAEYNLAVLKATAEDKAAAVAVEKLISALNSPVTKDDEGAIQAARKAYDSLTDVQKALVTNANALVSAERELAELKATEKDKEAAAKVEQMIAALNLPGTLADEEAILTAREAYDQLTDLQKALVTNLGRLVKAENDLAKQKEAEKGQDAYKTTGDYIESLGDLDNTSDWMALGMVRSGRQINEDHFIQSVIAYVQENANANEQLHRARSSDNSRTILALTALGYDVTNVGGHNLLMGLTDLDYVKKQGINGPIWALIAYDSNQYEIPENPNAADQTTREKIIDYLLDQQLPDGGWALSGTISDSDITGMTLQALAPYYKTNPEVKKAVDEALDTLSRMQNADGSFSAFGGDGGLVPTSESISQVLVALSALGIDADKDPRFIKNGNSVLDALLSYYVEGGGFRHIMEYGRDGMATEQAYYALTAYYRMLDGRTSLYDMTDVAVPHATPEVTATPEPTAAPEEPEEEVALAVDAAEGEDEKKGVSAVWIAPPVGIAGIVAYLLDRKRRKAKG